MWKQKKTNKKIASNPQISYLYKKIIWQLMQQHVKKILLLLLPAVAFLSSCSGLQHIRVEEVRNVSVQPSGGGVMQVTLDTKINNPSSRKVQLTSLDISVELRGSVFATISAKEKVVVPRHSNAFQQVLLEVRLRNLLTTLIALQQKKISPDELTVEGTLNAKAFPLSKTIRIEKQSLSVFAAQYGDFITPLLKVAK
jgi:LEA14-like dessication related protein